MRICLFQVVLFGATLCSAPPEPPSETTRSGTDQKGAAPAPATKKDSVDEKAIRALIAELGDESFVKREAAHKRLAALGEAVLPLLQKAVKESADAEVRERVDQLLRRLVEYQSAAALSPEGLVFDIAFSKDGQSMAAACSDKIIRIYDWKTRHIRQILRGHSARVWSVAFAPDGKKLASVPTANGWRRAAASPSAGREKSGFGI